MTDVKGKITWCFVRGTAPGKSSIISVVVAASTASTRTRLAGICLFLTPDRFRSEVMEGVQCSDKELLISNQHKSHDWIQTLENKHKRTVNPP